MSSGWKSLQATDVTDRKDKTETMPKSSRQCEKSTTESGFGSYKEMSLQEEDTRAATGDSGDDTDDGTSVDIGSFLLL